MKSAIKCEMKHVVIYCCPDPPACGMPSSLSKNTWELCNPSRMSLLTNHSYAYKDKISKMSKTQHLIILNAKLASWWETVNSVKKLSSINSDIKRKEKEWQETNAFTQGKKKQIILFRLQKFQVFALTDNDILYAGVSVQQ